MLVIRRRAGESILVGDEIEVRVLEVSGTRVKLGFVARPDIAIVRSEARATASQNLQAAAGMPADSLLREWAERLGSGQDTPCDSSSTSTAPLR